MKIKTPKCPECGKKAVGTVDVVPAIAYFAECDKEGEAAYDSSIAGKLCWDGQYPETNEKGEYLLTCGAHEWYSEIEGWEDHE